MLSYRVVLFLVMVTLLSKVDGHSINKRCGENGVNIQNVLSMGEEMTELNTLPIEEQLEIIMCAIYRQQKRMSVFDEIVTDLTRKYEKYWWYEN